MIYEYAVSPLLFKSLDNIGFLHEAFGLDNGRFISDLPKKRWVQLARQCIKETARDDIEKSELTALLMALDKRALYTRQSCSWSNDNDKKWIDNVLTEHASRAFQGILHHEKLTGSSDVLTTSDAWRDSRWKSPPSISVARNKASYIVQAVMPLLSISTKLILIDRNFEPSDGRFSKVLVEFAEQVLRQSHQPKITEIKYVTTYEGEGRTIERFEKDCRDNLPSILPAGISIKFIIKSKKLLHDRFILTDKGCIQLGIGLDEGEGYVLLTRLSHHDFMLQLKSWDKVICHSFTLNGTQ
jgi:hypothetical protein